MTEIEPLPALPSPPAPRPRWYPPLRALAFLLVFFVVQVIAVLAVFGLMRAGGVHLDTGPAVLISYIVTGLLLLPVTVFFLRVLDRRPPGAAGLRWPVGGRRVAVRQALLVPLAALALPAVWITVLALLPGASVRFGGWSGEITGAGGGLRLAAIFIGFLLQGGTEELLVRGYIYQALRQRWSPAVAVVASAAVFGGLHSLNPDFSPVALVNIVLAGVILALLVERRRSLWASTLAHGTWNFAISCLLSLPVSGVSFPHLLAVTVSGPRLLTGDGFGPEGSLLLTALALPIVFLLARRLPPDAAPEASAQALREGRPLQEIAP